MLRTIPSTLIRRMAVSGVALCVVVFLGSLGYWLLTGMRHSALNCVYMSIITITTVGFGEVIDLSDSPGGRLFTIFFALCGIGMVMYLLSSITAFLVEGELTDAFRRRRMQKKADSLANHFIVCGVGRVGFHIAQELSLTGRPCVIVDVNSESVKHIAESFENVVYIDADATDNDTLLAAGIAKARGIFVAMDDDHRNLVVTFTAKQLNPSVKVVTRCGQFKNIDKMRTAGADAVISPSLIGGLRMASEMIRPSVVSFLDVMLRDKEKNLRIEEVPVSLSDRKIADLDLHKYRNTLLLAVQTATGWVYNPPADLVLDGDAKLVLMTTPSERVALAKQLQGRKTAST